MRPSLLQLSTKAPMNLKPTLRSGLRGWLWSGRATQALLSFCVTFIPLSPSRYLQMALVLVCAHAVALGSALASCYPSRAVGWHRLVGAQRPCGDIDEPWHVHCWTLMLLSLFFPPFCPFCLLAVPSKGRQVRTTCSSLATVKHREITASTSPPAKPSKRWDNCTPVCHLPLCLSVYTCCLSVYCISSRVLWNCSDFFGGVSI